MRLSWVKNAVVVVVSSGLFLAAAEFFFRVYHYEGWNERIEEAFDPMYGLVSERSWIFSESRGAKTTAT